MKKNIFAILLNVMLALCCVVGLTACSNKDGGKPFVLQINEQNVSVTEFFDVSLTTNYEGDKIVEWSVENQEVVSVNNGVVTALSQGVSKVYAKVNGKTAETQITVTPFNEELLVIILDTYEVSMEIGDSHTVVPTLKYDGKVVNGAFSYESLDEDVLLMDDYGRITARALGNKSCIVTGEFNGYEKAVAINVNVITKTTLSTSVDTVRVDAVKDVASGLNNEYQLGVIVKEANVTIDNPQLTYLAQSSQDVFTVSQTGLITGINAGNAILTVSYTDTKGALVTKEVAIIVSSVTKNVTELLSIETDGEYQVDLNDVINSEDQIKGVYTLSENQLKTDVAYADNKLSFASVIYGDLTLVVETRNVIYNIPTNIDWQIFISQDNVEELKGVAGESIYLTEDLDLSGQIWNSLADYSGEFDGCGSLTNTLNSSNYEVFFTQNFNYHEMATQYLLDITDLVTNVSCEQDGKTIYSKLIETDKNDLKINDKIYAIPHYELNMGMGYDAGLFKDKNLYFADEIDEEDTVYPGTRYFVLDAEETKSPGPDGEYDTYDDGLPSSMMEFYKLLDQMIIMSVTPFVFPGMNIHYTNRSARNLFIGIQGVHTIFHFLPKENYPDKLSKWYSSDGTQLCYTARGNAQEYQALKNEFFAIMKEEFMKNTQGYIFNIGQEDKYTWCGCSGCLNVINQYGAESATEIIFCNELAQMMREWMKTDEGKPYARDFKIMFLAYQRSLEAPKKGNLKCDPNVMVCFAADNMDYFNDIYAESNKPFHDAFNGWIGVSDVMNSCRN